MALIAARKFIRSDNFLCVCEYAGWGEGWIRDAMTAVDRLPPGVRPEVVADCVKMMKALARLM